MYDCSLGVRQISSSTLFPYTTLFRSIYSYGDEQLRAALKSKELFEQALKKKGYAPITTEIRAAPEFYYAEDYHQQYLGKNPNGYCGLGGTGVSCPVGVLAKA